MNVAPSTPPPESPGPPRVPEPGQVVTVRGMTWAVADVRTQGLPRSPADEGTAGLTHVVSLQSLADDRLGEDLQVVWELEVGNSVAPDQGLPEQIDADGFDDPATLAAFVDAVRWGAVTSADSDSDSYQAPFRSGATVKAYQLEPLRRALQSSRTNLLLADDVGLGKTIEAGLVVQELLLRHRARSVVVVCPPSLALKWRDEMRDMFVPGECARDPQLILVGASNLWFAATQSVIVMPFTSQEEETDDYVVRVRQALGDDLSIFAGNPPAARALLKAKNVDVTNLSDTDLASVLVAAAAPPEPVEMQEHRRAAFDPVDLLVPEWRHLLIDPLGPAHDTTSGLTVSPRERSPELPKVISRVLAVESLRKVNALFGFTRLDAPDRVDPRAARLVPLSVHPAPRWTVATEDFGEGIFLQLDEAEVSAWERRIEKTDLWTALKEAHRRNVRNRASETAGTVLTDAEVDARLRAPRYWLVHTLAHVLIRTLAMSCGYSAASLSERLYAWPAADGRPAAAGLLLCTTASDSDGTLGGLVAQSEPDRLDRVVTEALRRARRCSSDPICGARTPRDQEDFLHGAACHCCVMASETSCERANRFLDRRFLVDLPGSDVGFFAS